MSKLKYLILILIATGLQFPAWSQSGSTNSPYSRYGYGLMSDRSMSGGLGMGGLGYGLRKSGQINTMNPASYSAVDSLTFLFDVGVDMQFIQSKDEGGKYNYKNGNVKNINMLFSLGKGFGFSAGLLPVSQVGYKYGKPYTGSDGNLSQEIYAGSGGLQQVYAGLGYKYRDFSVGANVGYMFGDINFSYVGYPEGSSSNAGVLTNATLIRLRGLTYSFGVQQMIRLDNKKSLVAGLVYSPKIDLSGKATNTVMIDTTIVGVQYSPKGSYEIAQSLGLGVSLIHDNKWMVSADVSWENWEDSKFYKVSDTWKDNAFVGAPDTLNNRMRYAAGVEYTPDARSRNYLSKIQYRAGVNYSNSYITTDAGVKFDELGFSVGLGLPVNKSVLNLSFNYVKVKPSVKNYLSEDHFKIALSFTFNETWFKKWRLH